MGLSPHPPSGPGAPGCFLCLAVSELLGPAPNSPGYLLLNQVIWKKQLNAFKIQRNVFMMAEGSGNVVFKC